MTISERQYKAIFSDFDGTLNDGKTYGISSVVKDAIRKWVKAGNIFCIATGRPYAGVIEQFCQEVGLTTPQIVRGGAEIIDPQTGTRLFHEDIPDATSQQVIEILQQNDIAIAVEQGGTVYTQDGIPIEPYGPLQFRKLAELSVIKDIPKILILPFQDEDKRMLIDEVLIKQFPQLHIVRAMSAYGINWDITSIKATKQLAVFQLLTMLALSREEVIGIGDSYNDFPLLAACGYKVAIGNAVEDLKAVADYVAPSQREHGVASIITTVLNNEGRLRG